MKPCKIPQNKTTCGIFKKGGPLDNCKKGGARGDRLIRLTQYPPLPVITLLNDNLTTIACEAYCISIQVFHFNTIGLFVNKFLLI